MSSIHIDVTQFGVKPSDIMAPAVVGAIQTAITSSLAVIKDKWQYEAQQKLNSTRPMYMMGLDFNSIVYPYDGQQFSGAVILRGKLPNMIESGFSAFDMKLGFSKSPKRKITKNKDGSSGWYLTIPMRHGTPNSFMYGQPMPKDVYAEARKLKDGQSLSVSGGQGTSWNGYQHKTNKYDGLTRIIKSYTNPDTQKTTRQSYFMTFRRVSNNSDPSSWMHRGYIGAKIADSIMPYSTEIFETNLKNALSGFTT